MCTLDVLDRSDVLLAAVVNIFSKFDSLEFHELQIAKELIGEGVLLKPYIRRLGNVVHQSDLWRIQVSTHRPQAFSRPRHQRSYCESGYVCCNLQPPFESRIAQTPL